MKSIKTLGLITGITLAFTVLAGFPGGVKADDSIKGAGARALIARMASPASTQTVSKAMACPKCTSTWTAKVDATAKGTIKPSAVVEKHLCGGCDTKVSVAGQGKTAHTVAAHECDMALASCCATK